MKTIGESLLSVVFLIFWIVVLPIAGLFAATVAVRDGVENRSLFLVTTAAGDGYLDGVLWPESKRFSKRTGSACPIATLRQEMTEL